LPTISQPSLPTSQLARPRQGRSNRIGPSETAAKAAADEKAAPGSCADIEHAEGLWRMLRAFVKVAAAECEEALGLSAAGNTTT
jgi:hypothetical protein